MGKLQRSFFLRSDVVLIGRQLLGKHLFSRTGRKLVTGGIIVETEAYAGPDDRASHAYNNLRTKRTETMFQAGGTAYVYLCYGMHSLFNIVTNIEGIPHAILIRAIHPTHGVAKMLQRRNRSKLDRRLAGGPASLTKALSINTNHNGVSLTGSRIWLEDKGVLVTPHEIEAGPRIGVDYAGSDAKRPWRFRIRNSPWTSKPG